MKILPAVVTEALLEETEAHRMAYLIQAGCDMGDVYLTTANFMLSGIIFPTIAPSSGMAEIPDMDGVLLDEFRARRKTRFAFTSTTAWDYALLTLEIGQYQRG